MLPDLKIDLPTLAATHDMAKRISPHIKAGDTLLLAGNLGAGKTEFARALILALGVAGDVHSPTFTLLQTYDVDAGTIYHFDLYRLKSADELDELGWDDALTGGIVIAEWPERAQTRLPRDFLHLTFTLAGEARSVTIQAVGAWQKRAAGIFP